MTVVQRHRTAMARTMLSRPMALAFEDAVVSPGTSVFDYGCGRGDDLRRLRQLGVAADGWDPNHRPGTDRTPAAVVNLGFVINVIEDVAERRQVLREAWSLTRDVLVVGARPSWEGRGVQGRPHADGILTGKSTFQKFYEQDELRAFIETTLAQRAVAAAPGVFYIFRDEARMQAFLAGRARRHSAPGIARVSDVLYEVHRNTLAPLQTFVQAHRRLPAAGELDPAIEAALVEQLGSIRAAFSLLRRATGASQWSDIDIGRPTTSERRFEAARSILEPLMAFVDDRA